jgi:hypothetical protein
VSACLKAAADQLGDEYFAVFLSTGTMEFKAFCKLRLGCGASLKLLKTVVALGKLI